MKKKFIISILTLILFMLFACNTKMSNDLKIEGTKNVELGYEYEYTAYLNGKEISNDEVYWKVNNDNVTIVDNVVTPVREGNVKLSAILKNDPTKYCIIELNVIVAIVDSLNIYSSIKELQVGKQILVNYRVVPEDTTEDVIWKSSDTSIATVDEGIVTGVGAGTVTISARCGSATSSITLTVYEPITEVVLYNDEDMAMYSARYLRFNIDDPIITAESDNIVLNDRYIYAVKDGKARFTVTSKANPELTKTFTIKIRKDIIEKYVEEEYENSANVLYDKLTLEQRVGQLFVVSTSITNWRTDDDGLYYTDRYGSNSHIYLNDLFEGRPFGNLYITYSNTSSGGGYYGGNSKESIMNYINGYQNYVLDKSGVGAIVMAEKSERTGYKTFSNYFSDYLRNITLGTINNYDTSKKAFSIMASEISKLGVNTLVNGAYVHNEYIADSFSKIIDKQVLSSAMLQEVLKENDINLAPLFGYTNGLKEDEAKYMQALASSDVDMIEVIDSSSFKDIYNKDVITYLRKDLKYKGLISNTIDYIFDWGFYDDENYKATGCVDAFNNGYDLFRVTFEQYDWGGRNNLSRMMFDQFVESVEDGTVDNEKFEEAVKRVLIYKLKNGIIDGTFAQEDFGTTTANSNTLEKMKDNASTYYVDGDFKGLDLNNTIYAFSAQFTDEAVYRGSSTQYNFSATMFLKGVNYGFTDVKLGNLDSTYKNKIAEIQETDQVVVVINNMNVNYTVKYEDGNSTEVYDSWDNIVAEIAEKTKNITLVFMQDIDLSQVFEESPYVKIYANYDYEENFDTLLKVLATGKVSGVSPYEQ